MGTMTRDIVPEIGTSPQDVAENIRAQRQQQRLSVREVGEQLGVSANWVSERETGKRAITVADLLAFASALGVRVAALLGIEPRPFHPVVRAVQEALEDPTTTEWERRQLVTILRNGFQTWTDMRRPPVPHARPSRRSVQ